MERAAAEAAQRNVVVPDAEREAVAAIEAGALTPSLLHRGTTDVNRALSHGMTFRPLRGRYHRTPDGEVPLETHAPEPAPTGTPPLTCYQRTIRLPAKPGSTRSHTIMTQPSLYFRVALDGGPQRSNEMHATPSLIRNACASGDRQAGRVIRRPGGHRCAQAFRIRLGVACISFDLCGPPSRATRSSCGRSTAGSRSCGFS